MFKWLEELQQAMRKEAESKAFLKDHVARLDIPDVDTFFFGDDRDHLPEIDGVPSYQQLLEQNALLAEFATTMSVVRDKAEHLLGVMAMVGSKGVPVFDVNEDVGPDNVLIIRHAVLDLQAELTGSPVPPLVLSGSTH